MSSLEFSIADSIFERYLELKHPVDHLFFNNDNVNYFDQDGFELTGLERASYEVNGVKTTNILNHVGDQRPWIKINDPSFKIDHSAIMQRWQFVQHAQDQLHQHIDLFPQLRKFLNLQSKWGLDFDLDYYDHDCYVEVMHIEVDYRNYYEAIAAKSMLEERIKNTDWHDFVQNLLKHQDQWAGLKGFAQNDWKARYWGLSRAEVTEKAIAQ
jgi:hypothetical protein